MSDETHHAKILAHTRHEIAHPRPSVTGALASLTIAPGGRVLDAGCGPGPHLGLFLDSVGPGGSVVGLDQNEASLDVAAEIWAEQIAANRLRLQTGDLVNLPFADASFDLTWTSHALHHVGDPLAALRELRRVVAPGGIVAILDADASGSFPFLPWPPEIEERVHTALFRGAAENYGGKLDYIYHPFLGRALPRLLCEAGLAQIRLQAFVDVDQAPLDQRQRDELRHWVQGWVDGRLHDYLTPADREAVLTLFEDGTPADLLASPDFFLSRMSVLAVGQVDASAPGSS